jgi:hypothetical protein
MVSSRITSASGPPSASGFGADRRRAATCPRSSRRTVLDERLLQGVVVLERQRLVGEAMSVEHEVEVELGRRAREHADRGAVHVVDEEMPPARTIMPWPS